MFLFTFWFAGRLPEYSSVSSLSTSLREIRRQPRSYKVEKHPSPAPISSNIIASMTAPRPPDKNEALFATENSTVVTAQIGSTANLPCIVKNNGNGVVSLYQPLLLNTHYFLSLHT